jgi:hypothetical protein
MTVIHSMAALPPTVGAASGEEAFASYSRVLNWIADTKKKMPDGGDYEVTPAMREEAYNADPLVSGIISPFLKNITLSNFSIETKDNKKYEALIEDVCRFLKDIGMMNAFREDFEDYALKHGHSYRRKDYDKGIVNHLQRLEPRAMEQFQDIWDSRIRSFHQNITVSTEWKSDGTEKTYNSWFVPDCDLYIPEENEMAGEAEWNKYVAKYGITDVTGLRVDNASKIIVMDRVRYGNPPPIDKAILAIWLKRLLLANGPNYIFNVLSPFLHIKNGQLALSTQDGESVFVSSLPEAPPASLADIDPERYDNEKAIYDDWVTATKNDVDNIVRYRQQGGVFASGPDKELKVVESGRSISPAFISTMISLLNEDIGQAFGFPVSLIMARGAELATSDTIQSIFNTSYAGARFDYQSKADELIKERFESGKWSFEITAKDGTVEKGTYGFDEACPEFKLFTGDVDDALIIAQTNLENLRGLEILKNIGGSKADVQMLADEYGITNLDLENFGTETQEEPGATDEMFRSMSALPDEFKADVNPAEEKLKAELLKTYKEARKSIDKLLE